jgi:N-acetylmuramoyl-L-alanine amidase
VAFEKAQALAPKPQRHKDRARAEALFDRVAHRFPKSELADDALLRAGRIRESAGDLEGARRCYERLLAELPEGDVAPIARHRLSGLGKGTDVLAARSWSGPGYTRIVLDVSGAGVFSPGVLPENPAAGKPHRIFLDFPDARLGPTCTDCLKVMDGLVRQVRLARLVAKTIRAVLDLEGPAGFRVFSLEGPSRVVVDVFREKATPAAKAGEKQAKAAPPALKAFRIVVDPGHGGKDPGALGPGGLLEKDVVLAVAKDLAELLKERLACEVKLTRSDDRFIPLEERTAIANAFGADLFVSIHANASPSGEANGVETYYLERASDRAARRLAAQENASSEAALSEIEHILADLLLTSKVRESRRLAEVVQEALVSGLREHYDRVTSLGVKRAPFYVLTGAVMPAVLVETAFITHPEESRRLADPGYRRRTAEAVAKGVEKFFGGG